jgi:hypothetical protein
MLLLAALARAEGVPSTDSLLPGTTVGYVSVMNYDNLNKHWEETQLGKMAADPAMEPFRKDMREQIRTRWVEVSDRLGIHLDDLAGVPAGEAALAMIEPKPGEAATVLLIDVTGRLDKAQAVLAKARTDLLKNGATESRIVVEGAPVFVFDVPTEQPAAAAGQPAAAAPPARQTVYFLTKNVLGASDNLAVTRGIIKRLVKGAPSGSLAEVVAYQEVMKRCAADAGGNAPLVRWFISPLGYAEAIRAVTPAEKRRKDKTIIEIMRNQGFAAIRGVGGHLDLATDGFQATYRLAVYAPGPYVNAMQMLKLPNKTADAFLPQPWVPGDIATYTTLYVDILNAFDNFGYLWDEVLESPGNWADVLEGEKTDEYGPHIDLREELVKNLGQRVTMVTDYQLPITTQSERLLFSIDVKDAAAVAKAVEKSIKNEPNVKKREIDGRVIWEFVEPEEAKIPSLELDLPSLAPAKKEAPKEKDDADDECEEHKGHLLPHGAITVAQGHLLVASHIDFLLKVLKPLEPAKQLRNNKEFLEVWKTAETRFKMGEQCVREFSWTAEEVRPTYELVRQGKMPESESILGRALNSVSGAAKKGTFRQQRIKGGNLPDYDIVRRALGPATVAVTSEPNGWFFKGVLLPNLGETPAKAAEKPAPEKPAPEKPAPEKPAPEKPAAEKPVPEKPAPERPAPERPAAEKPATEEPAPEIPAVPSNAGQ